jgi:uncharacterized protein (TIGR02646 family)
VRNLRKLTIPTVLEEKAAAWLADFLADRESNTKRHRYREPTVKAALVTETGSKCIYCESKIGHNTPGDVEHKVPTSKVPEKHFEWANLTISCAECNRRKNDYYDAADGFLDPYSDDVEQCLIHLGPLVHWAPGNARAETAVRTLALDSMERKNLIDRKKDVLEKARALLDNVKSAGETLLKALRKDELARMGRLDAEYSAMVLTYLRQVGEV